jgi:hypothetical protein
MFKSTTLRRATGIVFLSLLLLAVLALPFAGPAQAAEIITGEPDAILPAGTTIEDDLVIAGTQVRVDGTVRGDVFAFGQTVEVNGVIEGNLFVGAQYFTNSGSIDGSVYAFAYSVTASGETRITDNLYGFGFSVQADAGSQVTRSLYAFGYQASLAGEVGRDVTFGGAAFRLDGAVGRNLIVRISEPQETRYQGYGPWTMWMPSGVEFLAPGYEIGDQASVAGETDYQVYDVPEGREWSYTPDAQTLWGLAVAATVVARVGEFITLFLVGALLYMVWPTQVGRVDTQVRRHPWRSLGLGVLGAILFPFAFLLAALLIVLLGILIGILTLGQLAIYVFGIGFLALFLATMLLCFAAMVATKSILSQMAGKWLLGAANISLEDSRWMALLALLVGVFIFVGIRLIPILGWLVAGVVIVVGFGAMLGAWLIREPAPAVRRGRKAKR